MTLMVVSGASPWVMANTYMQQYHSHQHYGALLSPKQTRDVTESIRAALEEKKRLWENRLKLKAVSAPDLTKKTLHHAYISKTDASICTSCENMRSSKSSNQESNWSSRVKVTEQTNDTLTLEIDLNGMDMDDAVRVHVENEHVVLHSIGESKHGKSHETTLLTYRLPSDLTVHQWTSRSTRDKKLVLTFCVS